MRRDSPAGETLPICYDEWNLWFKDWDIVVAKYNLRDSLFVASVLNTLQRWANWIPIACLAQMVNCLGLITADDKGTFLTPSAWVFKLYAENAGEIFLKTKSQSDKVHWRDNIKRRHSIAFEV